MRLPRRGALVYKAPIEYRRLTNVKSAKPITTGVSSTNQTVAARHEQPGIGRARPYYAHAAQSFCTPTAANHQHAPNHTTPHARALGAAVAGQPWDPPEARRMPAPAAHQAC